jgi:hypothetical protein
VPSAYNTRLVSHIDCPGGGQVWLEGRTLYLGHMRPPSGTTFIDVDDPRRPRLLAHLEVPGGLDSHKVRVANGIMLVNREKFGESTRGDIGDRLFIYDVARPHAPKLFSQWTTPRSAACIVSTSTGATPTSQGYIGNIEMILDLLDPARPVEVGCWWVPGQWEAGSEDYSWRDGVAPRCHHPLRVSYWHHGFFILDIADMTERWCRSSTPVQRFRIRPTPAWSCRNR